MDDTADSPPSSFEDSLSQYSSTAGSLLSGISNLVGKAQTKAIPEPTQQKPQVTSPTTMWMIIGGIVAGVLGLILILKK